jgi:hypothetical protein
VPSQLHGDAQERSPRATGDPWRPDHRRAKIREGARAAKAIRDADRAEAEAWSIQMEGYGGPAQPSPTIAQCLNGGYGWLEIECHGCKTRASIPLEAIRRPRDSRS